MLYDEAHSDGNTQGLERYGRLSPSTGKPGESEDPRIRSMSMHRHRGFDLVFVTQWPSKIHNQACSLIGSHTHMNRAFGMQHVGILTCTRVRADPYDERIRDKADAQGAKKEEQGGGAFPAAGALAPLGAGMPATRPLTREEYVQKHKPRVEFQPWSAPAFEDRTVQSQPELYCMASGTTEQDTTCTCVTEQGTRAKISIPVCVAIAREGPAYNPYRAPRQESESSQDHPARGIAQSTSSGTPEPSPHALVEVGKRPTGTFPETPPYPASFTPPQSRPDCIAPGV